MGDLKKCIDDYLSASIDSETFSYDFPSYYGFQLKNGDLSSELIYYLDNISEACSWYEPSSLIRQDDEEYIDEKELRKVVTENYKLIKSLLP